MREGVRVRERERKKREREKREGETIETASLLAVTAAERVGGRSPVCLRWRPIARGGDIEATYPFSAKRLITLY